jgi:hypothetical protein
MSFTSCVLDFRVTVCVQMMTPRESTMAHNFCISDVKKQDCCVFGIGLNLPFTSRAG